MRDYKIKIRNEADFYIGADVRDRHYAKMSSSEVVEDREGSITLEIGAGTAILTPDDAARIAQTLASAAHFARRVTPREEELARNMHAMHAALSDAGRSISRALERAEQMGNEKS